MRRIKRILYAGEKIRGEKLQLILDTQSNCLEVEVKDMNRIDESITPDLKIFLIMV